MTISYPLSMPSSVSFTTLVIGFQKAQGRTESPFTLEEQIHAHAGDRWRFAITYPPLTPDQAREVAAFLMSLDGGTGTFMVGDPQMATPRGLAVGTPLVKGAGQAGLKSLITDGWTPSTTNVLKKGDYIQIDQSLYMILNDASSNGSGEATFDVGPRLRSTVVDNAPIITSSPKQICRLEDPTALWTGNVKKNYDIAFTAIEVKP